MTPPDAVKSRRCASRTVVEVFGPTVRRTSKCQLDALRVLPPWQDRRFVRVEVLGVHPVESAEEPYRLVELEVAGEGEFQMGAITQPQSRAPVSDWQVPYDEHQLAADGGQWTPINVGSLIQVRGAVRLAFFFHYLALEEPLRTSAGSVPLPVVTP